MISKQLFNYKFIYSFKKTMKYKKFPIPALDSKRSSGSFSELVSICLENGSIMSTTDLSHWISSCLYGALNIANKLAPCHRNHPLSVSIPNFHILLLSIRFIVFFEVSYISLIQFYPQQILS